MPALVISIFFIFQSVWLMEIPTRESDDWFGSIQTSPETKLAAYHTIFLQSVLPVIESHVQVKVGLCLPASAADTTLVAKLPECFTKLLPVCDLIFVRHNSNDLSWLNSRRHAQTWAHLFRQILLFFILFLFSVKTIIAVKLICAGIAFIFTLPVTA